MPRKYVKREPQGWIQCPKCGYSWLTTCTTYYASCPSCSYKVRNPYWKRVVISGQPTS